MKTVDWRLRLLTTSQLEVGEESDWMGFVHRQRKKRKRKSKTSWLIRDAWHDSCQYILVRGFRKDLLSEESADDRRYGCFEKGH
jgi:hypothetical protein